jgi:hypothetical protein
MRPARRQPPRKPPPPPRKVGRFVNGRAWINGDEVGGADPRYAHLNRSYD